MMSKGSAIAVVCASMVLVGGRTWLAHGEESRGATLQSLVWLVGDWRTDVDGDSLQESWSEPFGDSMVGNFRWVKKDGRTSLFEFLTIMSDNGELTFRFRHFGRSLTAWEEKDAPLTFKLTRATDQELVWENPDQKALMKQIYRREGTDKLHVLLESKEADGSASRKEFHFVRRTGAGS